VHAWGTLPEGMHHQRFAADEGERLRCHGRGTSVRARPPRRHGPAFTLPTHARAITWKSPRSYSRGYDDCRCRASCRRADSDSRHSSRHFLNGGKSLYASLFCAFSFRCFHASCKLVDLSTSSRIRGTWRGPTWLLNRRRSDHSSRCGPCPCSPELRMRHLPKSTRGLPFTRKSSARDDSHALTMRRHAVPTCADIFARPAAAAPL